MKEWIISDTHFNHANIATYCDRPDGWHDMIIKRWNEVVADEDLVLHLGDFAIGNAGLQADILKELKGRKILVLGNHDNKSLMWYMRNGFEFACNAVAYKDLWLTHRPSPTLPITCSMNIHGHLHNNAPNHRDAGEYNILRDDHRLFCLEWTNYRPVQLKNLLKSTFPTKALVEGRLKDKRIVFASATDSKRIANARDGLAGEDY